MNEFRFIILTILDNLKKKLFQYFSIFKLLKNLRFKMEREEIQVTRSSTNFSIEINCNEYKLLASRNI